MNESIIDKINDATYVLFKAKALVDCLDSYFERIKPSDDLQEVIDDASLIIEDIKSYLIAGIDAL